MNLVIDSVPVRQDNAGRYCLNDLHKAAGAERRNDPHDWLRLKQIKESDTGIPVTVVKGGCNQDSLPQETQPNFFKSKFPELLRPLDNVR